MDQRWIKKRGQEMNRSGGTEEILKTASALAIGRERNG